MGDEDILGKMVGEGEKSGKREKREIFARRSTDPDRDILSSQSDWARRSS